MPVPARATIAGRQYELDRDEVERAMEDVLPEPLVEHFVVVAGRRFPPKQVVTEVTGLDRADFTTHQARSVLRRLGLVTGRCSELSVPRPDPPRDELPPPLVADPEEVERHRGQWVAVRDGRVLVAHEDPRRIVDWVVHHGERAQMVRVLREGESSEVAGLW
jgi:hypothetical protein